MVSVMTSRGGATWRRARCATSGHAIGSATVIVNGSGNATGTAAARIATGTAGTASASGNEGCEPVMGGVETRLGLGLLRVMAGVGWDAATDGVVVRWGWVVWLLRQLAVD